MSRESKESDVTVLKAFAIAVAVILSGALGVMYAGVYNMAADEPHWGVTERFIEAVRVRSIAARLGGVPQSPALNDPQLIAMGAEHYAEMCTGCHLAPGMKDTEIRTGLYPKPPNLVDRGAQRKPAERFWIIKHGLKMTGMPAWGFTHDDQSIWAMVAFLQKLPELSRQQYDEQVAQGRAGDHAHHQTSTSEPDEDKSHSHGEDGH
jgi:mono/diheme cytochrome c family protein